jgi:phospholipid transport system substrate-binding protein
MTTMKAFRLLLVSLCFGACLMGVGPSPSQAQVQQPLPEQKPPETNIAELYSVLQTTMKHGAALGMKGRMDALQPVLERVYNLPMMTRLSVGIDWVKATPDQQKALIAAFTRFSVATYASRFKAYDGEEFKVLGVKQNGTDKIVETTLTPAGDRPITLNYRMRQETPASPWQIIDVFVDGTISEMATRRSEFSAVIRNEGIPALIATLNDRADKL